MIYLYLVAIFILTIALLLTIGVALVYFGLFERITVKTGPTPFPFTGAEFAYKIGKGKAADATAVFTEACSIVPRKATIGLYLELEENSTEQETVVLAERKTRLGAFTRLFNPVSDDCHYVVGVITTPSPDYKPESFDTNTDPEDAVNKPASEEERKLLLEKGFKFGQLPTSSDNVVYATFPFRGIISIAIGMRRVYSVIAKYIEHHRLCAYPLIELYDRDSIYYIMPLSQQDQFTSLFAAEPALEDDNTSIDDEETEIDEDEEDEEEERGSSSGNSTSSFEEL